MARPAHSNLPHRSRLQRRHLEQRRPEFLPGHPEGYLEGFANIYKNFAAHILAVEAGETPDAAVTDYPTIEDGIRGMAFIEACVASSSKNAAWTQLSDFIA